MKSIISKSIMLIYPDINQPFISTWIQATLSLQLSWYKLIWKLNPAQLDFPIMDRELLCITQSFKHLQKFWVGWIIKTYFMKMQKHISQWFLHQYILISQKHGAKIKFGADGCLRLPWSTTSIKCSWAKVYAIEPALHWEKSQLSLDLWILKWAWHTDEDLQLVYATVCINNNIDLLKILRTKLTTFKSLRWVLMACWAHIVEQYHISLLHAGATYILNTISLHFGWPSICKQV